MSAFKITGLCAAPYTPFSADGSAVNLPVIDTLAESLSRSGVHFVFVCGTAGEGQSMSPDERRAVASRWVEAGGRQSPPVRVIVQVAANSLETSRELAAHAQSIGAAAVAMHAPCFYRPSNVEALVECCSRVAASAPEIAFYYYEIPSFTGFTTVAPYDFLVRAHGRIPNLAGMKFSNPDLCQFQLCKRFAGGKYDIPFGCDEFFLAAYCMGARSAIGSTYNFAPGPHLRMFEAMSRGDVATASDEQYRSLQLCRIIAKRGPLQGSKALLRHLGLDVGPARLPLCNPSEKEVAEMVDELRAIGFFDWRL